MCVYHLKLSGFHLYHFKPVYFFISECSGLHTQAGSSKYTILSSFFFVLILSISKAMYRLLKRFVYDYSLLLVVTGLFKPEQALYIEVLMN